MQFLKFISIFILLISGNVADAFASSGAEYDPGRNNVSLEIAEDIQELSSGAFPGFGFVEINRISSVPSCDFSFSSSLQARKAKIYITYCSSIDPSLDISEIIFPFHSFL